MKISSTKPTCLIGYVFNPDDNTTELKSLLINDGRITKIIPGKADLSLIANNFIIELASDEVILPAFINLHTHIGYNVLPIWESPFVWKNRHQWRNHETYNTGIKEFVDFIKTGWTNTPALVADFVAEYVESAKLESLFAKSNSSYLEIYTSYALTEIQKVHAILSEIQAVCGGTGLLLQTLNLDDEDPSMKHFLIRNTGNPEDLDIAKSNKIFPVVDFFRPDAKLDGNPHADTSAWNPVRQSSLDRYINSAVHDNDQFHSTIAHIGEGKTGNLHKGSKDSYSGKECVALFERVMKDLDAEKIKKSNLILVHANGIDYQDKKLTRFIREHNISIVWSPVSNLLLYDDTLPVEILMQENINVCLGTDWTPSGSKHILDEMKFARFYSKKLNLGINDLEIFKMGTSNPARALGNLDYAQINEGGFADLFVYKIKDRANVIRDILESGEEIIKFSMINGRIVYGDTDVFKSMQVDYQQFPDSEGALIRNKGVSLNSGLNFILDDAIRKMDKLIETYSVNVLKKRFFRPGFLTLDDKIYYDRIAMLKKCL